MPTNLPREWYIVEESFRNEKSLEKKIELLKQLISLTPKHKGTENLIAQLKKRLSKLESEMERKSRKCGSKVINIEKNGDILVSILGMTKSGKSTLLKKLTNADVEISDKPFTTKEPQTGICFYEGVYIQFVEIPSFFLKEHLSIAHNSDILMILVKNEDELKEIEKILKENRLEKKRKILINPLEENKEILKKIIEESEIVRVFMKPPGKNIEERAVVLKRGRKIKDLIEKINENWLKSFKFARVYDNSIFSGRRVGLEYELKDGDVVEIHF
ncbi:MAG: TGS domain-containing protein [Candidatus Aenigmarchaeota archaeon]|nr:TGS domain-containing protein [Candidatus Aenigmarchaeota archaeon]MDW8159854.1 TGS domain-containing protein [Candidatus Aenigmarchaeota archaeon]